MNIFSVLSALDFLTDLVKIYSALEQLKIKAFILLFRLKDGIK